MNLQEFANELMEKQLTYRQAERGGKWEPSMTPATSLGYDCERRSVYQQTHSQDAKDLDPVLASIFTEGNLHQKDVRKELLELGLEVQEAERPFKDHGLQITGKIDGKLEIPDASARKGFRLVPLEIKSTQGNSPKTDEQWRNSETPLLRRYYAQIQIYMFLSEIPEALGLFKDKGTGTWTVCPSKMDYEYCEKLAQRAERIRDAVAIVRKDGDDYLPDRIADRSECNGCPWRDTICHPAEAPVDPMLIAADEVLLEQLIEREALDGPRKSYKKIDDAFKTRVKMTNCEEFVVGGQFHVKKKVSANGAVRVTVKRIDE